MLLEPENKSSSWISRSSILSISIVTDVNQKISANFSHRFHRFSQRCTKPEKNLQTNHKHLRDLRRLFHNKMQRYLSTNKSQAQHCNWIKAVAVNFTIVIQGCGISREIFDSCLSLLLQIKVFLYSTLSTFVALSSLLKGFSGVLISVLSKPVIEFLKHASLVSISSVVTVLPGRNVSST